MKKISDKVVTDNGYRKFLRESMNFNDEENAKFSDTKNSWGLMLYQYLQEPEDETFTHRWISRYEQKIVRSCILGGTKIMTTMET